MFSMASSSEKSTNLLGKRNQEDVLETKLPILKKHKDTTKGFVGDSLQGIKSNQANLIFAKEVLCVANLSPQTEILDIINFFKNVGKVVRVQLIVNHECKHVGYGFVQFASANEATKAMQTKNGEYLHDHKIVLEKTNKIAPPPKFCIDHKVWYEEDYRPRESLLIEEEDNLETKCNETPNFVEDVLLLANLSPQTERKDIVDFFENVGKIDRLRLIVNAESKHVGYGFIEFCSANETKLALEQKNGEYLHDHKIFLKVAKAAPYPPRHKYNLVDKLCYEDYIRRESFEIKKDKSMERLDENPHSVKVRKKTLSVANIPCEVEISDIINFFKDIGEVVHVRRLQTSRGVYFAFVEFACANDAEKALVKKNGEYLRDNKIELGMRDKITPLPKYCLDHKVWYEDYLRREGFLIEEDEAVDGLDETLRQKTVFIANLPCETEIQNIIHFFKDVGEVVNIRLIVNDTGKEHVGCCFVEFASVSEANEALETKYCENNPNMFLDVVKTAPYPLRSKFNLVEKLWYEERILIEEDETMGGLGETLDSVEAVPVRKKTLYIANLPYGTEILEVIDFFKDVGEVVHVRLFVNHNDERVGYGFVEFASANEAKKALQIFRGEYVHRGGIFLEKIHKIAPPPMYCIDHKVWYREDYLMKKPIMELKKSLMEEFCGKKTIFSYEEDEESSFGV